MALSCGIPDAIAIIKLSMRLYDDLVTRFRDARRDFITFSTEVSTLKSTLEGIQREYKSNGNLIFHCEIAEERNEILTDLNQAVSFTKESLQCWNTLLRDFEGRPQDKSWRVGWMRKYRKLIQCRDRFHVQSKLLEFVMLRIKTSRDVAVFNAIKQLERRLQDVVPPLPADDSENFSQNSQAPTGEIQQEVRGSIDVQSVTPSSIAMAIEEEESRGGGEEAGGGGGEIKATDYPDELKAVIQSAQSQLQSLLRNKRVSCQPQIPGNTPPVDLAEAFHQSALLSDYNNHPPGVWLRVGTWWLLKSIKLSELLGNSNLVKNHVNLLKASWILYTQLGMNDVQSPETQDMIESLRPEERTLLENLSSAIGYHTKIFQGVSVPTAESLQLEDPTCFDIWENIREEPDSVDISEHALDPRSWITIKDEHAGSDDEEVLHRSFVQAQIGSRAMRTLVDPDYLLVLVVPSKQTEPIMVLTNQAGTMKLSCKCSSFRWANEGPLDGTTIRFDQRTVPITFKSSEDYKEFTRLARVYFDAVKLREPLENENKVFQGVLQDYSERNVNSMGQCIPPPFCTNVHDSRYWEVRVYETNPDKYWQKSRRLVICDCAREKKPKCSSFFLPMSWVYVSVKDSAVTAKWSDCNQRNDSSTTGGSFDNQITYEWIPDRPNRSINVKFLNNEDAAEFRKVLLSLNVCRISKEVLGSWSNNDPKHIYHLYRVRNMKKGTGPESYKYLVVIKGESTPTVDMEDIWEHSEVYFFGREIDYTIDEHCSKIDLRNVYSPLFISNHVHQPKDVQERSSIAYSHTEAKLGVVTFSMNVAAQAEELHPQLSHTTLPEEPWLMLDNPSHDTERNFLTALSDNWEVVLSMNDICIEYAAPKFIDIVRRIKRVPVYLQVWREKTNAEGVPLIERLVARQIISSSSSSSSSPSPSYSSGSLPWISIEGATWDSFSKASRDTRLDREMFMRRCTIRRGKRLDMTLMLATNGLKETTPDPLKNSDFTIKFRDTRQKEDFSHALSLRDMRRPSNGSGNTNVLHRMTHPYQREPMLRGRPTTQTQYHA